MAAQGDQPMPQRRLEVLGASKRHTFIRPIKKIHESHDVPRFLISQGYADIMIFIMQLNRAMCPRSMPSSGPKTAIQTWPLNSQKVSISEPVSRLRDMLQRINSIIDEVPPDTGPRRFGNASFRKWHERLESRASALLDEFLPVEILDMGRDLSDVTGKDELLSYLLGGFGSSQRLDYGTGHELSFMAFLGCMWKLGGFEKVGLEEEELERSIVLYVVEPYLSVVRRLILTYTLEPAGSHGVWGLDDHSFMPYIFGSAQYCPAICKDETMPVEGSLLGSPSPADITRKESVENHRPTNMYFSAVGFINDVKTGSFWEHSPILFDISGVQRGWGKINKGMLKMFDAEVLGKFPVVQHFPFGSLFSWEQDPNASTVPTTTHTSNQPSSHSISVTGNDSGAPTTRSVLAQESMRAPWASTSMASRPAPQATKVPWAHANIPTQPGATAAPWATPSSAAPLPLGMPQTRAPWGNTNSSRAGVLPGATQAPWASTSDAPR